MRRRAVTAKTAMPRVGYGNDLGFRVEVLEFRNRVQGFVSRFKGQGFTI